VNEAVMQIRVRYCECDPMGVAHHSVYPVWFEMGRTELLRESGLRYRDLEEQGAFLAVVDLSVRYRSPARYDDQLELLTQLSRMSRVRIEHEYTLTRDGLILATASTTLACLDGEGRLQPVPERLHAPRA
jgi:acyl-CoA thioester hydrolase